MAWALLLSVVCGKGYASAVLIHATKHTDHHGGWNGTGGLEAVLTADLESMEGAFRVKAVVTDAFGNTIATVTGLGPLQKAEWSATRVGGYGPLPNHRAEILTAADRLAESLAWRGRRIDPTGFYWLGARYYEPSAGRFLSPDPLGHGSDMSLYAFANGDPVNRFDPDGRLMTKIGQGMGYTTSLQAEEAAMRAEWKSYEIDQLISDYGLEGMLLREAPLISSGENIYDFYSGETTSGRIYGPLEWWIKGTDVAATTLLIYSSASMRLASETPPLASVLEGHGAGQGFTGVYDAATGEVLLRPSTAEAAIPEGWVPRSGGHANVSAELGGDAAGHSGFAAIIQENGSLNLTWRSGTLNRTPGNLVPGPLRMPIVEAVESATGRAVNY